MSKGAADRPVPKLYGTPVPPLRRGKAVEASRALFPDGVPMPAVRRYLKLMILGPEKKWAFSSIGKNASSSTLRFLYELEFGHPLTAHFQSNVDINPSAIVHMLAEYGVFSRALYEGMSAQDIQQGDILRLMVCRNPVARAISGYLYFCRSDAGASPWFLRDRLRIDAAVGFDWDTMPGTLEGFRRFLRYIEAEIATMSVHLVDGHWRPQVAFAYPEIFKPSIIGRVEELPAFFADIAAHFDRPLPAILPRENRQSVDEIDFGTDKEARRLIERIYAQDFETFGY